MKSEGYIADCAVSARDTVSAHEELTAMTARYEGLRMLVCDLLLKNEELRVKVKRLQEAANTPTGTLA
jgi:hypothetical protein